MLFFLKKVLTNENTCYILILFPRENRTKTNRKDKI
nr:MAG TPA: hypothetical protein [Caudoviricetes sp.]